MILPYPPGSEMIVNGSIDAKNYCIAGIPEAILEVKTDSGLVKLGTMVSKTLVIPSHGKVPSNCQAPIPSLEHCGCHN